MTTNTFFPRTESEQIVWLSHYALKLPIDGSLCGIGAEEITGMLLDITYWVWMLQHWHPATQPDAKEATAHKLLMIAGTGSIIHPQPAQFPNPPPAPGMQKRLFSQIARIKASLNYIDAIDTVKPYYDERPLAPGNTHETRKYRLR